jgi:hypothetical protein
MTGDTKTSASFRRATSARSPIRILVAVLATFGVIVLGGWALATRAWDTAPGKSDVVGTWQSGDSAGHVTFYASGKVTFYNIPRAALEDQGERVESTTPITMSGKWDPFWNYGWWGGVEGYVEFPDDSDSTLMSTGNALTGYHLSLEYGKNYQLSYDLHRVSSNPSLAGSGMIEP